MKKRNIYFVVLLLLVGLTIMCNKAETLVEPEDGSYQFLVVPNLEESDLLLADSLYFSYMVLYYDKDVYSDRYLRDADSLNTCLLAIANSTMGNEDTVHTIRCGSVKLGGLTFEERHCNYSGSCCKGYYVIDSTVIMKDWNYRINFSEMLSQLVGPTEFRITGSNVIQDVGIIIDIPERNEIISPQPGAVVNINEDLVVQLKRPIGGKAASESVRLYGGKTSLGRHGIYSVSPVEPSNEVIITSSALQEAVDSWPEAEQYYIYVKSAYHENDGWPEDIPLYYKNGNAFAMIKPTYRESFCIDIVIKK